MSDEPTEENPYRAPQSSPEAGGGAVWKRPVTTSLHGAVLKAWRDLLTPRGQFLADYYREAAHALDLVPPDSADLDHLRQLVFRSVPPGQSPDVETIRMYERKLVMTWRAVNGWTVFWGLFFPASLVTLSVVGWISQGTLTTPGGFAMHAVMGVVFFYVLMIFGMFIQAILMWPFAAVLRLWTGATVSDGPAIDHE